MDKVKALIWVHSAIGAVLVIAFFAVMSRDLHASYPILACGVGWFLGMIAIERRAAALTPADRVPATGLPGWLLALFAVGQVGSLAVPAIPHLKLMIVAYFFAIGTLLCRGFLSVTMNIPIHGRTWTACMLLLTVGLFRHLGAALADAMGC